MKPIFFLPILFALSFFVRCAAYQETKHNLQVADQSFPEPKVTRVTVDDTTLTAEEEESGLIPLVKLTGNTTSRVLEKSNSWFPKLKDWSEAYTKIAKDEIALRNFCLAKKYSKLARIWAERAVEIKSMSETEATEKVMYWIEINSVAPEVEPTSYFMSKDVAKKIKTTTELLSGFKNNQCLIQKGVPIMQSKANLLWARDLYNQKRYVRASNAVQVAYGPLANLNEDELCKDFNRENEFLDPTKIE